MTHPSLSDDLEKALARADLNAMRVALYQLTGDPSLKDMRTEPQLARGGAVSMSSLASEHREEIIRKALEVVQSGAIEPHKPPSNEDIRELMELFSNTKLTENEYRLGVEELGFDEFPRGVDWNVRPTPDRLARFHATIVGAGISGLAIAVLLHHLGIRYTIIEREADIGGTWLVNRYPDCRVDVPTQMYQFKFEKNYPWSEQFAARDETLEYLHHIARKHAILPQVEFNSQVDGATWVESKSKWKISVTRQNGARFWMESNFLFNATGQFSKPKMPDIEGLRNFAGKVVHTANWDTEYDYTGKRIAIIGNGSSGTQLMPTLARYAKRLSVFQRTPQWMAPFEGYKDRIEPSDQLLFDRIPHYWNWYCYSSFYRTYQRQHLTVYDREWQAKGGRVSEGNDALREDLIKYIRAKMGGDEEMVGKLIPPFPPLARRLVVDNGWYEALAQDNVELVCDGIRRFTPEGILTMDGTERSLDFVVLATGFHVSDYFGPIRYVGRGDATPAQLWSHDGARAYLSILIPGFPNFFMFYGPNAQPRAGGHYTWAESWTRYAALLAMQVIESGASEIEVKRTAYDFYNRQLDTEAEHNLRGTASKGSYYVNEFGRASVNVPWLAQDWHAMLASPNFDDFLIR